MPTPRFLTVKEFLEYVKEATGITWSRSSAYRAIQKCRLPTMRLGGKLLIDRQGFEEECLALGLKPPHASQQQRAKETQG